MGCLVLLAAVYVSATPSPLEVLQERHDVEIRKISRAMTESDKRLATLQDEMKAMRRKLDTVSTDEEETGRLDVAIDSQKALRNAMLAPEGPSDGSLGEASPKSIKLHAAHGVQAYPKMTTFNTTVHGKRYFWNCTIVCAENDDPKTVARKGFLWQNSGRQSGGKCTELNFKQMCEGVDKFEELTLPHPRPSFTLLSFVRNV